MNDEASQQASLDEIVDEYTEESEGEAVDTGKIQEIDESPIEGWELRRLGEVFSLEYGENLTEDERDGGQYPVYGSNGQVGSHSEPYVDHPGIVVGRKGSIGEVEFSEESFHPIDTTYYISQGETDENLRFVYYLLENIELSRLNAASAIPGLNRNDAYSLKGLIPPLHEQRKIASVLYNVDKSIEKTEEVIQQTKRVKKGVVQDIFRYGLKQNNTFRSEDELQETYLGEIPREWELQQISTICSEVVDCPHSTPDYEEDTDDGILVARTSEIEEGRFSEEDAPRVTKEEYRERISRLEPEPGDIIFTREAPIGEAFKIPEGMKICLGQRVMILRPEQDILLSDYLLELIYSDMMQSWFERSARGTTSTHMNVGDVEELKIPLPDIDEQRRVTSVLDNYREKIENEMQFQDRLKHLKNGLMQDLLTGEVRTANRDIDILPEVENHG